MMLVVLAACSEHAGNAPRPEDAPGVERGWETDCMETTCGVPEKKYVICSDPNATTHFHYGGKSCGCDHETRCGECDPYGPCLCADEVTAWCSQP
jgi:hypothetical protein